MAAIINALFGTYPEPEQHTTNQTVVEGTNSISVDRLHTSAVSDDVQVKSVISSETQANASLNNKINIDNILSQLSTTHSQVDQYSRARTAEINEQAQKSIADVLANTQRQQEDLLVDANRRHLIIDNDYRLHLQKAVEALDGVKAKTLADLERDLQVKQQSILADAKRLIDVINDQANAAKLHALVEAQEQAKDNISHLADQVAAINQQDTQNLLQSTTTTIITSKSHASGNTETVVNVPVTERAINASEHHVTSTNDTHKEVALKGVSDVVPILTTTNATAFGTVTGASDLTTTPALASSTVTTTHTETEVKQKKDNTNF